MDWLFIVLIFIFGTLVGSFINVLGLRYNSGLSPVNGRSRCLSCNAELKWFDLVPVFSFLFLLGRCRFCKSKISYQYPLVEFLTGLVFVGVVARQISLWPLYSNFENGMGYCIFLAVYYFVVFSLLFAITIYDFRHKIIPNSFVYWFIGLALFKLFLFMYIKYPGLDNQDILDLFAPLFLFIPFALLWYFSSGKWIGFGDAKLVFGIGALLGFVYGISAVVLGFWIGAIWSIIMLISSKLLKREDSVNMKSELPFAPFLIAGVIIVFLLRIDVMNISSFLGN
ncbi:MAG: leader peptidase (prepilin peptidase) / N-methyltransferase [Parcubacteria bacterium C7867-003]|nr:MAG: leader peptidase (prepilin peptidase) / N-methyltransferase [Parcubacteria bacterium C7867-003]